ncbi:hypothetical protein Zmor_015143 [Zophobas morio]|uniref:Uncharacterized protein n=1 Tax=Zophobas morio TaxID=2755281 RepID=A0AA38IGN4_9CUCU|nr:hypothetical protein Zmor_015143 [Zophobas morio]
MTKSPNIIINFYFNSLMFVSYDVSDDSIELRFAASSGSVAAPFCEEPRPGRPYNECPQVASTGNIPNV